MLAYPLSVFIDTNVFINEKFNFSDKGTFALFKKHIVNKKVQLYISNIVKREVEKHIYSNSSEIITNINSAQKKIKQNISKDILIDTSISTMFVDFSEETLKKEILKKFESFILDYNVICLDNNGINLDRIINDYFDCNPPFENNSKKKYEFPDAFIISAIKKEFSKENPVYIISKDKGFQQAFEKEDGFYLCSSLKDSLDKINSQNKIYGQILDYLKYDNVREKIHDILCDEIEKKAVLVNGLDCDRSGLCEGYDYEESYILDVSNLDFYLSSVDEINDNVVSVTFICEAKITTINTYIDVEDSIWDPEEKEYIYMPIAETEEIHKPHIECSLDFSIVKENEDINFEFAKIDFELVLDQDTRESRKYIQEEDPRIDSEGDQLDALEEYYRH